MGGIDAVIVTQMSVGRSLKATFDYLVGTLGSAIERGFYGRGAELGQAKRRKFIDIAA